MSNFRKIVFLIAFASWHTTFAQQKTGYSPKIEACPCAVKADSSLKTICAYLIVPENRNKPDGKTIKLPFIVVKSNNPAPKKDPVLFTGGGPGTSSLGIVRGVHTRTSILNRDFIAFEQRGTRYSIPELGGNEIGEALKIAFRKNQDKDSLILTGVKKLKKRLEDQGTDLSGYTTEESAADIEDLRKALKIDSLNLFGISYSGGLLMTVLKNYPHGVRSLILDSPLPEFVHIDQEELLNFNEALNTIFSKIDADPVKSACYGNLKGKFQTYFTSIIGKTFTLKYLEKGTKDSLNVRYTKDELLGYLENTLFDFGKIKDIPDIITEMIKGNHQVYVKEFLNDIFGGGGPSGMRMSVYCSDKMAFAKKELIEEQFKVYPYMKGAGYYFNDVTYEMCKCWDVPAISSATKTPFYSKIPALLAGGDTDPATRPIYNDMIHHYLPNSQRLLFQGRSHGPMIRKEGDVFIGQFLDNPFKRLTSGQSDIVVF